ncbi:hypothetical protein DEU56DRAFT_907487 [Suillus clintonianus]|uniref:uncharacterized protein n=1 Tax=Suillus clintonianus TaxID=1904413 RepID=UPI001B85C35A|nr:uncharacterized protein DEU56DRAFT_907487 [Suillus clintonianus]KAG2154028.1 hypothetical protein DEU56DRAFT_907487 [Suillus clintonianus]
MLTEDIVYPLTDCEKSTVSVISQAFLTNDIADPLIGVYWSSAEGDDFNFPSSLQLYGNQRAEMRSRILSVTSASASPFEQILQLGSAAVIIFEHSFYVFDKRRHSKDQQESVPSFHVALERYMASPHAIAVRDAVNAAVHANQGNSSNWKAKLRFWRKQPKDYSGLLETILKIALEHRLLPDEGVTAVITKNGILETFGTKWMIGADGAKGIVHKEFGLTFLGETRNDTRTIAGDIRLKGGDLDGVVRPISIYSMEEPS